MKNLVQHHLLPAHRELAQEYTVNLYGRDRTVLAYDRVLMPKSLKCRVRVVWIFRKIQ